MKAAQKAAKMAAVKLPIRIEEVEAEQARVMPRFGILIPAVLRVK
jgi:hypothetical protein